MLTFNSFGAFGQHLINDVARAYKREATQVLRVVGQDVAKTATAMVGVQQGSIGPFPAWAPLAQSTIERKTRAGYSSPASPLLASGRFRGDIDFTVRGESVTIGTSLPYIVHTELGTSKMPPRPVFGPAAIRAVPRNLGALGNSLAQSIAGTSGFRATSFASGARWSGDFK